MVKVPVEVLEYFLRIAWAITDTTPAVAMRAGRERFIDVYSANCGRWPDALEKPTREDLSELFDRMVRPRDMN